MRPNNWYLNRRKLDHIHGEGPSLGICTIADLAARILDPEEHARLWVGYCKRWLEQNEAASLGSG